MPQLQQTIQTLNSQIPQGKIAGSKGHKDLLFKQFKPSHLAPQGFTTLANIDKMKDFITKFANSETVQKEAGDVSDFKEWLTGMQFESISQKALDQLIEMTQVAEERSKIALIDLIRILFQYEGSVAHILYKHWETFDLSIFQYLLCLDIKDPDNKVIHNYHLVSLKMLGNIYQTNTGLEYFQNNEEASQAVLDFCSYSLTSVNPKTVFTAAVVVFNHVLTFKGDITQVNSQLQNLIQTSIEVLSEAGSAKGLQDNDAITALLLAETRMLYKNDKLTKAVQGELKDKFEQTHSQLRQRVVTNNIKEAVDDLLQLI